MSNVIYLKATSKKARFAIQKAVKTNTVYCVKSLELDLGHFTLLAIDKADYEVVKNVKSSYVHVPARGVMTQDEFKAKYQIK
jgi:hypothetical protein